MMFQNIGGVRLKYYMSKYLQKITLNKKNMKILKFSFR